MELSTPSTVKCPLLHAKSVTLTVRVMEITMRAVMAKLLLLGNELAPSSTGTLLIKLAVAVTVSRVKQIYQREFNLLDAC